MANSQINQLLEFVNLQMAAEAFLLEGADLGVIQPDNVIRARLERGNFHASRFMPVQAGQFVTDYEVLAQYRNDPQLEGGAGFSGTLFRNRSTGELTLSFRSSEFIDDAVRDGKSTNELEIKELGWALGQISEMEAWFAELRQDPALLGGHNFNVTGYSLGGHLATAFNILRREEAAATGNPDPVLATYTFNGAGTGAILDGRRLTDILADFNRIRANYAASPEWNALSVGDQSTVSALAQSRVEAINDERFRVASLSGVTRAFATPAPTGSQTLLGYQIAALLVGQNTVGASDWPGGTNNIPSSPVYAPDELRFGNMIEVVGMETGGLSTSFVSNSGVHYGYRQEISIEAQPLFRGSFLIDFLIGFNLLVDNPDTNSFADTHSLVLIVDSLSLMAAMEKLAPDITVETLGQIFSAMSNAAASTALGTQGKAEGDTLERALEAVRKLILGPTFEPMLDQDQMLEVLEGNTWHENAYRIPFQERLKELRDRVTALTSPNEAFAIVPLLTIDAPQLISTAMTSDGMAYRYALKELNPFALVGDTAKAAIYGWHNLSGELDLYDVANRTGTLTSEWVADRAAFLLWKNRANTTNVSLLQTDQTTEPWRFVDLPQNYTLTLVQPGGTAVDALTHRALFGGDTAEAVRGGQVSDRLYGGGGTDFLEGRGNNDYLEGGIGLDVYQYNGYAGLIGSNDGSDTIRDIDGKGVLRYVWNDNPAPVSTIIADASVQASATEWRSADGRFIYTPTPNDQGRTDLVVTINDGAGGSFTLKDFRDGDFGIRLWSARTAPETILPDIMGDLKPQDFDPNTDGVQTQIDHLGNVIVTTDAEPDRNDVLYDSASNDRIIAGGGLDLLQGNRGGDDWMSGDAGRDNILAGGGADLIEGGADGIYEGEIGGDIVFGDLGNDEIFGNVKTPLAQAILEGDTMPASDAKGDYLSGAGGDDWIIGDAGNDFLDGGSGQDLIVGGAGDDNIGGDWGYVAITPLWVVERRITDLGDTTLYSLDLLSGSLWGLDEGAGAADVIYAGAGSDWIFAAEGDDFINAGAGSDVIFGMGGDDVLLGEAGEDILVGDNDGSESPGAGSDYLDGGDGNDHLAGNGGQDVLVGGRGNDDLVGNAGKDIYVFNKGDGEDRVFDDDTTVDNPEASVLILGDGVSSTSIRFQVGSLAIDLGPTDLENSASPHDIIHFSGFDQLDPTATTPLSEIRFADGSSMTYSDILARGFDIDGTEGDDNNEPGQPPRNLVGTGVNDRINGLGGNDLIFGIRGDDVLDGGAGIDQLLGGPGADTIYGGSDNDTIWGDVEANGIFAPPGGDIVYAGAGNDVVQGDDGDDQLFGEEDDDTLYGDFGADVVEGGSGDDLIHGQGYFWLDGIPHLNLFDDNASDTLRGGDGNDFLNAAGGQDLLEGGTGADTLEGDVGADHLIGGDGNDSLWGDGADSSSGDDTLDGGTGNDQLVGRKGNDTYIFGRDYGQDTIFDNDMTSGNVDIVTFTEGITTDEVSATQSGSALVLSIRGTSDTLTIANHYMSVNDRVEEIRFADGTVWMSATIPLTIRGTSGHDVLNGTGGPNVFEGLAGNDTMSGGSGNDVYRIERGAGQDTIIDVDSTTGNVDSIVYAADIASSDVTPRRSGNNLVLPVIGTTDAVTISDYFSNDGLTPNSVEEIRFLADGIVWDVAAVKQMVLSGTSGPDNIIGYATDDVLSGLGSNDSLFANAGNDTLIGGAGNDLLQGGFGNDTYSIARADGQDTITDADSTLGNIDRIVYASDISPAEVRPVRSSLGHLVLELSGSNDWVTVTNYFENDGFTPSSVERVEFLSDGTVWDVATIKQMVLSGGGGADNITGYATDDVLSGLGGNDVLFGRGGNDTVSGGAGTDHLSGEGGADTYLFSRGDGIDIISNWISDDAATTDRLIFGADILPVDVTPGRVSADLLLTLSNGDEVRIANYFAGGASVVEEIRFANGTVWTEAILVPLLPPPPIIGTDAADSLRGTTSDEFIKGLGGNDTLQGIGGNDTFQGGTGEDWQYGGTGDDLYLFNFGDGVVLGGDVISDSGGQDTVQFGPGISPSGGPSITEFQDSFFGRYIHVDAPNTDGGVYILGYFSTGHIENIRFDDGTVWTDQTIAPHVPINGLGGNDSINGNAIADVIYGNEGNDTLRGFSGHDTIDGGFGGDHLFGDDGNDVLIAGAGEAKKSSVSNHLHGGSGDDVLVSSGKTDFLYGESGNDILIGGAGRDWLEDSGGSNLLFGGATLDDIWMGDNNDLVIAGAGNDFLDGDRDGNGLRGRDIFAFNKTDGKEGVVRPGTDGTISVGGGALYSNLSLSTDGRNLTLKVGNSALTLSQWYGGQFGEPPIKSISTLQIVIEGTRDYKPTSSNLMNNKKIQGFDFIGLVQAFDAARAVGQTFSVANNLANYRIWSTDSEAIGGAVAYQYARTGTLGTLTYDQMRAVINDPAFGVSRQSITAVASTTIAEEGSVEAMPTSQSMSTSAELKAETTADDSEAMEIDDLEISGATRAQATGSDLLRTAPIARADLPFPVNAQELPDAVLLPTLPTPMAHGIAKSQHTKHHADVSSSHSNGEAAATIDVFVETSPTREEVPPSGPQQADRTRQPHSTAVSNDSLAGLADEWFLRDARNDDLSLLDDIRQGEAGIRKSSAAHWQRSSESLSHILKAEDMESESAGMIYTAFNGLANDSFMFPQTNGAVGLRGVPGHALKMFTGLKEGISVLTQ